MGSPRVEVQPKGSPGFDPLLSDSVSPLFIPKIHSHKTLSSFYIKDTITQDSLLFLYQRYNHTKLSPLFISKIQSHKTLSSFYIKDTITQNSLLFLYQRYNHPRLSPLLYQRYNHPRLSPLFISKIHSPKTAQVQTCSQPKLITSKLGPP